MARLPCTTRSWIQSLPVKPSPTQILNWNSPPNNDVDALCNEGRLKEAFGTLHLNNQRGIPVDTDAYASLLQACANIKALSEGKQLHARMLIAGHEQDVFLGTKLVSMYAKCGRLENARLVFDNLHQRNVFLWNAMIRGYAWNGPYEEAVSLYYRMEKAGIEPDIFTFSVTLKACASLAALQQGREIHYHITRKGLESDVSVGTALIDMYAKCGRIEFARHLFDKMSERNMVSWSAMIAGYAQNGQAKEALRLFHQMKLGEMTPSSVTMVSVLQACADVAYPSQGKSAHAYIIKSGFESDVSVVNSLVAMYAQCRCVEIANQLFNKMSKRDVVSWNTIIARYAQNGLANKSLALFHQMQQADVKPNSITTVSVLPACAHLAALRLGKSIHAYIIRSGFDSDVFVETALIDMYAKCGSLEIARKVFDKNSERNTVTWSAMIAGYGMHGCGEDALALFSEMKLEGMKPDHITFVCILSACSHTGLVDEGWQWFHCMRRDYCIVPRLEHYACMVDLLGRAGHLDEAHTFIKEMPLEPDATVWGALLGACRIQSNIELGESVLEHLVKLDPKNVGNYVVLSNIYAAAGRWEDVAKVRTMLKDKGLKKIPGCSWIEIKNRVHTFLVGDMSHPQSEKIYEMLDSLAGQMTELGYAPDTSFVLHDVEEKEYNL
eukprot:Gb_21434 [translate_table: standard]